MSEILPILLALAAALLVSIASQVQNLGVKQVDPRAGTAVAIGVSALTFWLAAPFLMKLEYWFEPAVVIFAVVGLFRPALSANLSVVGLLHLGPTLSASLSATSPLFGVALGILVFGETLTPGTALGVFGIVSAVALLARRKPEAERSWPAWALFVPVAAGAVRSAGHVLSKIGMETVPDPYFATLVGFTVSFVVASGALCVKKASIPFSWKAPGVFWFALSGAIFGLAMLSLNQALLDGEVVTVIPIIASSPIFSMLLSLLIFRREVLTLRIASTVFMVFASVVLIALSRQ